MVYYQIVARDATKGGIDTENGIRVNLLKAKLVEKGQNMQYLAESTGMNPSTLYRKIKKGNEGLTIGDVRAIAEALSLTQQEAIDIFFT